MLFDSSDEEDNLAFLHALDDVPVARRVKRPRRTPMCFFDTNVSEREFREKHRVNPAVLDHLVEWIGPELERPNNRGLPLSPRLDWINNILVLKPIYDYFRYNMHEK